MYDNIYSQDIFDDIRVKVGKKTCKCNFMFFLIGDEVDTMSSEVSCDKKCSGAAKNVELGGDALNFYVVSFAVKKGKGKIQKATVELGTKDISICNISKKNLVLQLDLALRVHFPRSRVPP